MLRARKIVSFGCWMTTLFAGLWSVQTAAAGPFPGYVGHTSPHSREIATENFSRPDKDGNIRPVSLVPADKVSVQTLLSGTVYYMVYERDDRDPSDPWGTGIPNFLNHFRAGIDFNGGASPKLDTNAKYLYLYQVVNHQRTLPPIESSSVKLLVELSELTSWGHFHGLGFASKDENGVVRPLSATHKIDSRTYLSPAPALPITDSLSLAYVPTSRGEAEPKRDSSKIVQVHWDALDPATPPDYVMILGSSDFDKHPSFRAIWSGKNAIGKDGRSTAYGFTSNMPPTMEPVRLRTSREALKSFAAATPNEDAITPVGAGSGKTGKATDAVKLARLAEDEAAPGGEAIVGVEGRVPSPFPTAISAAFNPNRDDAGASSDSGAGFPTPPAPVAATGGGSSSGGSGGFVGNNNLGTPPASNSGGGGGFAGGGGTTIVRGQATAPATGTSTSTSDSSNNININFNISQSNQQSQSQYQYQNQKQNQQQNQSGGGTVVPEPATLFGLALGIPALLLAYRRRRPAATPTTPAEVSVP